MAVVAVPVGTKRIVLMDEEDARALPKPGYLFFNVTQPDGRGYVMLDRPVDGKRRRQYLHRYLLGLETGNPLEADHINRDRLDNRRANLRVATRAQNNQNPSVQHRRVRPAVRQSPHRGVAWHCRHEKWQAAVNRNGRIAHLGYYEDEERAATVAARARAEHLPFATD
jgi:hypothetical protein